MSITDGKIYEHSFEVLKATLKSIGDGVITTDLDGRVTDLNKVAEDLTGWAANEAKHKDIREVFKIVDSTTGQQTDNPIFETIEKVQSIDLSNDTVLISKDGQERKITDSCAPVIDAGGDIRGAVCVFRDITDRKRSEQELKDREKLLDLFFSQSLDGCFFMMFDEPVYWNDQADRDEILDYGMHHLKLTRVNQTMLDQYGAKEEDFIGLTLSDFFQHDLVAGRSLLRRLLDDPNSQIETREKRIDGSEVIISGNYVNLYDDQGRITGHFGVQRDITTAKRLAQKQKDIKKRERRQKDALAQITTDKYIAKGQLPAALYRITEIVAQAIDVTRVGIWYLDKEKGELKSLDCYDSSSGSHSKDSIIQISDIPRYLESIREEGILAVKNASTDPLTSELGKDYLNSLGITSMLDAGIHFQGELAGILCLEHVGEPRVWHPQDKSFANIASSIVTQILINIRRNTITNRYRQLIEQSPTIIFNLSSERKVTFVSPVLKEVTGFEFNDIIGRDFESIIYKEDLAKAEALFKELDSAKSIPISRDLRIVHRDGTILWLRTVLAVQHDENNILTGYTGNSLDITAQNKILLELEETKEELETYFNSSLDLLSITDFNGKFLRINPAWEKVLGYSIDKLEGQNYMDFVHPDDIEATKDAKSRLADNEVVNNFENRYLCKDGSFRWIEWRAKPVGEMVYSVARDITERRLAEDKLVYQNKYQKLVSAIAESFINTESDGMQKTITSTMQKLGEFFGFDRCYLYLYEKKNDSFVLNCQWLASGIEARKSLQTTIPVSNNPIFIKDLTANRFLYFEDQDSDKDGYPRSKVSQSDEAKSLLFFPLKADDDFLGILSFANVKQYRHYDDETIDLVEVIVNIITESLVRKILQERTISLEKTATALAMAVTTNHEINQPLTLIQGYVEMLRNGVTKNQEDKYYHGIENAVSKIIEIIRKMNEMKEVELTDYTEDLDMVKLSE